MMWILMTAEAEAEPSRPDTPIVRRHTTFGSLRTRNFRLMAAGQLVSNVGWWMQYTALNWLVLDLTGSPAAVGLTAALQFLPAVVLGMAGGLLADRFPKRRILLVSYAGWISMVALLAGLTLADVVQTWQVQVIAAGFGIVDALSYPARQAFITEMVGPAQLRNAISITSSVIYLAGLTGPAIGGFLIKAVGPGWSFLTTAVLYTAPVVALMRVRGDELYAVRPVAAARGQLRAGLRYVVSRPDVLWPMVLVGLFAMFTGNLSVTLAVYAKSVYHSGAGGYGLLSAVVAVGSLFGALIAGRLHRTRLRTLMLFAAVLSALYMLSAAAPTQLLFCVVLLGIGVSTMLLLTSANSTIQLAAHDSIRGRVVGVYVLVYFGSMAIGGPLLGAVDEYFGPRAGMLLAGAVPGTAILLIATGLTIRRRRSRARLDRELV
ncbi:MFS transporter [Kribbella sp. NPDC050820]|uniref:MFS transporter n=1 Tax=Kribbella sp. NPDC050820 TaxID=3155408 RepID=UPI0033DE2E2E